MKKKKFALKKYADMHNEVTVHGRDETEVVVLSHIPYAEKEAFAKELAEQMIIIHDDSCVYKSSDFSKMMLFCIAKYYTNINTDNATPEEVADFLINNDLEKQISDINGDDVDIVMSIYDDIFEAVSVTYADDRSLTKAIRTSFGFLFTGEDVTESLAKAEAAKDVIYNALGALREKEEKSEKEMDNGTLSVGGKLISFAKKD